MPPRLEALRPYLYGAIIAAMLCGFTAWNGYPLITQDTPAYISRPASVVAMKAPALAGDWADPEKGGRQAQAAPAADQATPSEAGFDERIMASRSIYYGLIVFVLDAVGGLWAATMFQALIAGLCVGLLVCRGLNWRGPWAILGLGAALVLGTGASLFAGLMMPDLFAATAVLAIAMLAVFWDRLGWTDRGLLTATAVIGVVTHDSTLLIVVGLTVCIGLGWLARRKAAEGQRLRAAAIAGVIVVLLGAGAQVAFSKAAEAFSGYPPARFPYLTAHLAHTEAGATFIKADCATRRWAVCAYADALPRDWNAFLFTPGPGFGGASSQDKMKLSEDDLPLAVAFVKARPGEALMLGLRETGRQLAMFGLYDVEPRDMAPPGWEGVPQRVSAGVEGTRLWSRPALLAGFSNLTIGVGVAGVLALAAGLAAGWRRLSDTRLRMLTALVVAGLLGNAVVCGLLASPYDRFQARMMWLAPLLAICVWISLINKKTAGGSAPETADV